MDCVWRTYRWTIAAYAERIPAAWDSRPPVSVAMARMNPDSDARQYDGHGLESCGGSTADQDLEWSVRGDAIVERPRDIRRHSLLETIYEWHDTLISEYACPGRTLEVAFGQYIHPDADVGVEAWPENVNGAEDQVILGDARDLPFEDGSFSTVIGRRFVHHVPRTDRPKIVTEANRVLQPGGRFIVLEGTPALFRRAMKGAAARLGLLRTDTDIYGHLTAAELRELVESRFSVIEERALGSPLMVAAILEADWARRLFDLYRRTQMVRWWTLIVAEGGRADDRGVAA